MRNTRYENGFTLVELLIALMITSIVMTAVATLAYAMTTASEASGDTSQKQAQLRYATLRVSELLRNCKLICAAPGDDLAIWRADDDDDDKINVNELVYIEKGTGGNYLQLCEFDSIDNPVLILSDIESPTTKSSLESSYDVTYTQMIPQCSNAEFNLDVPPAETEFVSISFGLSENDTVQQYQISARLRSRAENLLSSDGSSIVDDDD